ncbi:MAG: hypothetical protein HY720_32225 [Planctomycetes bacterium]|nr:hypothetical protein [Planctomycetota bacterium]
MEAIVAKTASALDEKEHDLLEAAIEMLSWLAGELERKHVSLARLRKILFVATSEKTSKVLEGDGEENECPSTIPCSGKGTDEGSQGEKKENQKGHGRNGAAAFVGAKRVRVPHESLNPNVAFLM